MKSIILRGERQRDYAIETIRGLDLGGEAKEVVIRPYRKPRSLDQNSLFHGWVAIIASVTGNDQEDVKEALKAKFLPPRFVDLDGETIEVRRSTAKLNTKEMAEFCTRVQAWAASEFGMTLPTRDDYREVA